MLSQEVKLSTAKGTSQFFWTALYVMAVNQTWDSVTTSPGERQTVLMLRMWEFYVLKLVGKDNTGNVLKIDTLEIDALPSP